jgi:arylsulfatase A
MDILPTLAGITGAKLPAVELDGKDVIKIWQNKKNAKTPYNYFFCVSDGEAVRSGNWKYHKKLRYTTTKKNKMIEAPALYNLKDDIGETNNLVNKEPEIAKRLAAALEEHLKRIKQ